GRSWRLPVAYGGPHGVDLEMLSARHGVTPERLIELHSGAAYRVYMLGFAPGFAYLGGLPECLATPRREDPRLTTPAGTVSIGGAQSAVTSMAVPSGWHLIGQTPVRSFDPTGEAPFLFEPGDHVRFQPISADAFAAIAERIARGEFQLLPEALA
ncbi:MAG: 5-oxoprolinase subunit PxpB, partial [Pseudomonadota bacterium]